MSESDELSKAKAAQTNQAVGCGCLTLIAVVVVIWALTAAFGSDDKTADNSTPPSTFATIPAATTTSFNEQKIGEQAFLTMIRLKYPEYANASDASVIAVGNGVCGDMADGKTFVQVGLAIAVGGNVSAPDGAYIAGAAIGSICPEYKSEVG